MNGSSRISPFLAESNDFKEISYAIDEINRPSKIVTKFDQSIDNMATTTFPVINPKDSIKVRIATLEATTDTQSQYNKLSLHSLVNLSDNLIDTDKQIRDYIEQVQNHFDGVIATLKKEYDHRFELQSTENKRLQNNIASLKAEANQTKRKLHSTAEKLKKLKQEFGDPEDNQDDDLSFSGSVISRPNTTAF